MGVSRREQTVENRYGRGSGFVINPGVGIGNWGRRAFVPLQARVRGMIARRDIRLPWTMQNYAGNVIARGLQRHIRGRSVRRRLPMLTIAKHLRRTSAADKIARALQKRFRGNRSRRMVTNFRKARSLRAESSRKRALTIRRGLKRVKYAENIKRRRAAVKIQRGFKRAKFDRVIRDAKRNRYNYKRRKNAAVKIQKIARGGILNIPKYEKAYRYWADPAATRVQAAFRGYRARKHRYSVSPLDLRNYPHTFASGPDWRV